MIICRVCGVGIGNTLKVTICKKAGYICRICYKEYMKQKSYEHYHNNKDKSLRCVEPHKLECTECNKSFWTSHAKKVTCSMKCATDRKYRIQKEKQDDKKIKTMA